MSATGLSIIYAINAFHRSSLPKLNLSPYINRLLNWYLMKISLHTFSFKYFSTSALVTRISLLGRKPQSTSPVRT